MPNEDGSVWVVCNGEIYNFEQLRARLQAGGHTFSSRSDSEVLVHLYEDVGVELVGELSGMYAFAIWDEGRERLLLARDRLGIKPLYYSWDGARLLFGSELRAVLALTGRRPAVDEDAVLDYLTYGYVPHGRAAVAGISKLPPGHQLVLDLRTCQTKLTSYWDASYTGDIRDAEDAAGGLQECLQEAVGSHLVSDVPLGLFLSGGLDSSTVLAEMRRVDTSSSPMAFAIGFDAEERNELEYARLAGEALGADLTERIVSVSDARELLPQIVDCYDEPIVDYSTIPTYCVSALARESVTVALSGDGGDELFGGYHWHARHVAGSRRRDRINGVFPFAPALFRATLPFARRIPYGARVSTLERSLFTRPEEGYFRHVGYFDPWEQRKLAGPALASRLDERDPLWLFRSFYREELPPSTALRYLDLKTYLADNILVKVDRASMASSLEVRVPFLDHRVVEYVFRIDDGLMAADGRSKFILRRAEHNSLPERILARSKRGFSSPVPLWLKAGLVADVVADLDQWQLVRAGLIQPRFVRWFVRNVSFNRWAKLWSLVFLELWYRRWVCELAYPLGRAA
jgi:asparagine synthase (glutamine-hydrolysing)